MYALLLRAKVVSISREVFKETILENAAFVKFCCCMFAQKFEEIGKKRGNKATACIKNER